MKDSTNRKAQQREREPTGMVETSDDRNGVVVNRAIDSTTGIPNCLVEQRCKAKIAVRRLVRKMSTAAVVLPYVQCTSRPKIRISTASYSASTELEQRINFYEAKEASESDGS